MKQRSTFLSLGLWLGLGWTAWAQEAPHFTQYMQSANLYNPAFTGINSFTDFKLGFRRQWVGVANAPTSLFASVSGQFGNREPSLSLPVRGRLASKFVTEKPPVKEGTKHALGGFIVAHQNSPTSLNMGNLSYAAHIPLKGSTKLSIGGGVSVLQTNLDRDKLESRTGSSAQQGITSKITPDFMAGFLLHGSSFYAGYSANFLMQNKFYTVSGTKATESKRKVHHAANLGYKFNLHPNWYVVPGVLLRYMDGDPAKIDASFRVGYKDLLWFGPNFRSDDALSAFLGVHVSQFLTLSYAYDHPIAKNVPSNSGSHELILSLRMIGSGVKAVRPTMW
jgi:type IX secretion system PorP/SprF family membrane protein